MTAELIVGLAGLAVCGVGFLVAAVTLTRWRVRRRTTSRRGTPGEL